MKRLKHLVSGLILGALLSVVLTTSAGVRDYSTTAGSNASVSSQNWAEGMAPSAVNDSARKLLADLAELYQLLGGTLTTGGTANAQTLTPTVAWTAYTNGDRVLARIGSNLTNTGSTTLNVSALGTKTIYKSDGTSTLSGGELVAGAIVEFVYDSTLGGFRIVGTTPSLDEVTTNGADIASAGTLDLDAATGDTVDVTGTTTITAITLAAGDMRIVRFTGALTLTHGASLVLPGGANITTAAGDIAIFRGYASSVVRCLTYVKAALAPIAATQTEMEAATATNRVMTPAVAQYHPGAAKGWVKFSVSGGIVTVNKSHNVSGVVRDAEGQFTISWGTDFSDEHYAVVATVQGTSGASGALLAGVSEATAPTAGATQIYTYDKTNALIDPPMVFVVAFGDQ